MLSPILEVGPDANVGAGDSLVDNGADGGWDGAAETEEELASESSEEESSLLSELDAKAACALAMLV